MIAGYGCGSETVPDGLLLMTTHRQTGVTMAGIVIPITTLTHRSTHIRRLTAVGATIITGTVTTTRIVPILSS